MVRPSIEDGLHVKLLGNGFAVTVALVWQSGLASPVGSAVGTGPTPVSSVVPVGNAPPSLPSDQGFAPWKSTPFPSTVIAAPSNAPISEGSCNCSARLPFCVASQPTVASRGKRSICGTFGRPTKYFQVSPTTLVSGQL